MADTSSMKRLARMAGGSCSGAGLGHPRVSKYIDFEDPDNRDTYVGRTADPAWVDLYDRIVRPRGRRIADVGCGGGIYTKAIACLHPAWVLGIDSSQLSLDSARQYCAGVPNLGFLRTDAEALAVPDRVFDNVVERALIHHFVTLDRNFHEVFRVLKPHGTLWLQDRTVEDALEPPSEEHIRGFYMVFNEKLRNTEIERRRRQDDIVGALRSVGFRDVRTEKIHELRKVFQSPQELREEILTRRGRSLLHGLHDQELEQLADFTLSHLCNWPIRERDTWTVWVAEK
jgi:ubiquinone/menaquinone biosynthesis C-methylase UbiE